MAAIASPTLAPTGRRRRRGRPKLGRGIVLAIAAIYFLGPLLAAFWFSIHGSTGVSWRVYSHLLSAPGFLDALVVSAELALLTVVFTIVLMVPTMLLVHLRFPRIRPLVEVLALFPLVVPPVVLVVGVSKLIAWGNDAPAGSATGQVFNQLLNSHPPLVLALEYVVLVLPFSFRAIDAGLRGSSITTLTEAARGLGASWLTVLWRVVLPTLRTSVLNAAVLAFALVLGEFTMASILQYQTFPVWLLQFQNDDGQLSVALALMSLVLTWLVLVVFTVIAGRDPSARKVSS